VPDTNVIIAIEGLDGSGKTSVGAALAAELGAEFVSGTPSSWLGADLNTLMRDYTAPARYLLYLARAVWIGQSYTDSELPVVVDRYLASCHALHVGVPRKYRDSLAGLPVPPPSLAFYLDVSEPERLRRLAMRGLPEDPFERELRQDAEFRALVQCRFMAGDGMIHIQTDGLPVCDVASRAAERVRSALGVE